MQIARRGEKEVCPGGFAVGGIEPVSYTHLDVYKRQEQDRQTPYPLEASDYRFPLPTEPGYYNFQAELSWADGRVETAQFDLIVARYDEGLIQSVRCV